MKTFGNSNVFLAPVLTEKAVGAQAKNVYSFYVQPSASKGAVALAFRAVYGVKPVDVRVVVMPGKQVHFGKFSGKEKRYKKAIVTVPAGTTISTVTA
jgi:large subunit ribosomal protein L23